MANVALQNFFYELVKRCEERSGKKLDGSGLVEAFGFEQGKAIEGLLEGRTPEEGRRKILLHAVEALGGDSREASGALVLAAADRPARERTEEESIILNDRLMNRMQNLERFIRRIGKLDEFHSWLKEANGES